jgi:calcineurin-like phosphoesterase family protein
MTKTFLIADTHFSHTGVTKFLRPDGTKLRPWDDVVEMDEALIRNWNNVVSPDDKVYLLGDIAIGRSGIRHLHRCNGRKVLIRGNHDIFKLKDYTDIFYDIRGCHVLDGLILSHIPIHPASMKRFGCNIHGHLHYGRVLLNEKHGLIPSNIDPKYYCVSVEMINFTPIDFEQVKRDIIAQGGQVGFKPRSEVYAD